MRTEAKLVICPYCDQPAELVTGQDVYPHRRDLWTKRFWACDPCDARCGCHGNTDQPLGRLANAELRQARMRAHAAFDPIWKRGKKGRSAAYKWLADQLGIEPKDCHIGMFDVETCGRVVSICGTASAISQFEE